MTASGESLSSTQRMPNACLYTFAGGARRREQGNGGGQSADPFQQTFGACRQRTPRARSDSEGCVGKVSVRRIFRYLQIDMGPRRSPSACSEILKKKPRSAIEKDATFMPKVWTNAQAVAHMEERGASSPRQVAFRAYCCHRCIPGLLQHIWRQPRVDASFASMHLLWPPLL